MSYTDLKSQHWRDPKRCPMCGKPGTVLVGGRLYSADCARALRVYLAPLREQP